MTTRVATRTLSSEVLPLRAVLPRHKSFPPPGHERVRAVEAGAWIANQEHGISSTVASALTFPLSAFSMSKLTTLTCVALMRRIPLYSNNNNNNNSNKTPRKAYRRAGDLHGNIPLNIVRGCVPALPAVGSLAQPGCEQRTAEAGAHHAISAAAQKNATYSYAT